MPNTNAISNSQYEATVPCPHILATICERNFMGRVPLWQKYKKKNRKKTATIHNGINRKLERLLHNK